MGTLPFLEQMTDENFEKFQTAQYSEKLEKFTSLNNEASFYWSEIVENTFQFRRAQVEAPLVKTLTKQDLLDFLKKYLLPTSPDSKRLCVFMKGHKKEEGTHKPPENANVADKFA